MSSTDPATVHVPAPVADLDWDSRRMRAFADRALDLYGEYLERLDELPIARHTPAADVRRALLRPLPEDGLPDEEIVAAMREVLIEWGVQCGHPRFMAYITGSGTVPGPAST